MNKEQAIDVLNMIETHGSLPTKAKEMAIRALEERPTVKLLQDGTLVVNTNLYFEVKRVLVEYKNNGTLYYTDNERPKGKWKRTTPNYLKCTNCRKYICDIFRYNEMKFCPNCGAEMEVE